METGHFGRKYVTQKLGTLLVRSTCYSFKCRIVGS